MRTLAPAATAEESQGAHSDSRGDWTSLKSHERVAEVPVITQEKPSCNMRKTRRFSPQSDLRPFSTACLERNPTFPPEPRKGLAKFEATQEVPRHPLLHSRGTSNGPTTTQEEPRFSLLIPRGGSVSMLRRGGNPGVPFTPQRRRSSLDARVELQGFCHHFKKPSMSQCIPDTTECLH